jgi:hypothetical protein
MRMLRLALLAAACLPFGLTSGAGEIGDTTTATDTEQAAIEDALAEPADPDDEDDILADDSPEDPGQAALPPVDAPAQPEMPAPPEGAAPDAR